jgi:plasmid maintenance system killer protein
MLLQNSELTSFFQSEISRKTISEIKDHLLTPLQNLQKLKDEGQLMADMWCHFGKVLVHVDEGNNKFEEYNVMNERNFSC